MNASLKLVLLSMMVKILSFGIIMSVSTASLSFFVPSSELLCLCFPSNEKGFVTIETTKIHISFAIWAMTGIAPVPVPPHIPPVMKTISVSCNASLISLSLSSAAFLPISGFAPAPRPLVRLSQIFIFFSARLLAKSCASVLIATKLTPSSHSVIILLMALFPAPPQPITLIFAPGMNSGFTSWMTIFLENVECKM